MVLGFRTLIGGPPSCPLKREAGEVGPSAQRKNCGLLFEFLRISTAGSRGAWGDLGDIFACCSVSGQHFSPIQSISLRYGCSLVFDKREPRRPQSFLGVREAAVFVSQQTVSRAIAVFSLGVFCESVFCLSCVSSSSHGTQSSAWERPEKWPNAKCSQKRISR